MRRRNRALEAVGAHLTPAQARARPHETASAVLARLAREKPSSVELLCVVDDGDVLLGALPVARLFGLPDGERVGDAMDTAFPRAGPDADQEAAASLALHHGVDNLPVVDGGGRLLGVMRSQALLRVLRHEHVEDLHRLAGIQRESSLALHAIEDPPLRRLRYRLPWLLVGLAGSMLATAAMAGFEATFQARIAVAFFIPALVYLADAIGTQSETIAVRGLSLTHSGIRHLLAGELRTGMLIGAVLGLASFVPVFVIFGDARLAGAVATSIFAAGSIAAAIGLLLPWTLARLSIDPAYGSGPVATIIQDILSILVYFFVVRAFGM